MSLSSLAKSSIILDHCTLIPFGTASRSTVEARGIRNLIMYITLIVACLYTVTLDHDLSLTNAGRCCFTDLFTLRAVCS